MINAHDCGKLRRESATTTADPAHQPTREIYNVHNMNIPAAERECEPPVPFSDKTLIVREYHPFVSLHVFVCFGLCFSFTLDSNKSSGDCARLRYTHSSF